MKKHGGHPSGEPHPHSHLEHKGVSKKHSTHVHEKSGGGKDSSEMANQPENPPGEKPEY